MPIYNIRGIDVDFPLQAYDCQIVYMEKVIQSLQEVCLFVFFPQFAWRNSQFYFCAFHFKSHDRKFLDFCILLCPAIKGHITL